jgi:hypothetical protein
MNVIEFPIDRARKTKYTFDYILKNKANDHIERGQIDITAPSAMLAEQKIREQIGLWTNMELTLKVQL